MWCQLLLLAGQATALAPPFKRWLETDYPYQGPAVPIADPVDKTVNGDGKGFPRLYEAPAVEPELGTLPTNNINVISLAYTNGGVGMNVHFQTPYGIGGPPCVNWGTDPSNLDQTNKGWTATYDRTPPCSMVHVTQCSQFFHNVNLDNLQPATKYYYQIPGGNGTRASDLMWFTTGRTAGDTTPFTAIVVNDMGYTNAKGTHEQMLNAISEGAQFVWHGGDISYADDSFYGISPCEPYNASMPLNSTYQQVCYNGSMSTLPGGVDDSDYYIPLPEGEVANIGSNLGGDMSTMYEPNWDLWQQWMMPITRQIPYMTTPGNHEAACTEGDNTSQNETTAMLTYDSPAGSSAPVSNTTYGACPYSQRNFTAYRYRFTMPGNDPIDGSGNMWYSFSYGLAHFISFTGETDYPNSPEKSFADDIALFGTNNENQPTEQQTFSMDSGPFGQVTGNVSDNESYEQWNWMKNELASIDRSVTPWVFVMSHRPMYSSTTAGQVAGISSNVPGYQSSYQPQMRAAWEEMFIEYGVDAYFAGHIHWNERMFPIQAGGQLDMSGVSSDNHTYITNPGTSLIHLTNGQGGNVESHTELLGEPVTNITAFLDTQNYGMGKLSVMNATMAQWQFVHGETGIVGDYLTIVKKPSN